MRRILAAMVGLLLSVSAIAAVQISDRVRVNLLRGTSTVATLDSWTTCRTEALRRAQADTRTSGTVTYTCQTERRDIVAAYSPNPPPAPVDCVVGEWGPWIPGEWSACVAGQRSREETRQRDVLVDPANGGAACPTRDENRVVTEACTVTPPVGSALLSWAAPTTRNDGSPLTNLAGYRVRYWLDQGNPLLLTLADPAAARVTIEPLSPGLWHFALAAYDAAGIESTYTTPVTKDVR